MNSCHVSCLHLKVRSWCFLCCSALHVPSRQCLSKRQHGQICCVDPGWWLPAQKEVMQLEWEMTSPDIPAVCMWTDDDTDECCLSIFCGITGTMSQDWWCRYWRRVSLNVSFVFVLLFQVYIIKVSWSDGSTEVIYRRYSKFFDLQVSEGVPVCVSVCWCVQLVWGVKECDELQLFHQRRRARVR